VYTYKLDVQDGIEHIIQIVSEDEEVYDVETVHTFGGHEIRTARAYNKCIFEELLSLGIITPINS
jgi:hypothetical protein